MKCAVICADEDAQERDRLVAVLQDRLPDSVTVTDVLEEVPMSWEPLVVVVRVTAAALENGSITALFERLVGRTTIVPVVDDRQDFDFSSISGAWEPMLKVNALGRDEVDRLVSFCLVALGCTPNGLRRRVFLSYRRSDGLEIAKSIQRVLEEADYVVFRDETGLDGGLVQPEVMRHLEETDFMLLLSTKGIGDSTWVEDELNHALRLRIPIRSIVVDGHGPPPLAGNPPVLAWDPNLGDQWRSRLLSFVNEGISGRELMRVQVDRALKNTLSDFGVRWWTLERERAFVIELPGKGKKGKGKGKGKGKKGKGKNKKNKGSDRILLVWGSRAPSLELLYAAHRTRKHDALGGTLPRTMVCSEARGLSATTWEAARWAGEPHQIVAISLPELEIELEALL